MAQDSVISSDILNIDYQAEIDKIVEKIKELVTRVFRRRGIVLGLSGGIDSSVVCALCIRALGPKNVLALLMPEKDSASDTLRLSQLVAEALGAESVLEDITTTLDAVGCYRRRNDAIRSVIPEYTDQCKCKIVLPQVTEGEAYRVFSVVTQFPDGRQIKKRLTHKAYLEVVAATNFKQRIRKMFEYYHADRMNYVVAGTPNRQEYDQGFFVKGGDGAADLKPIAHLYKTQVYKMAEFLGVPQEIINRPPTTDTYPMEQSQEEFYFSVSYEKMDYCLYGKNRGISPQEIARIIGFTPEQVERVYQDIENKRKATKYLHMSPVLMEPVQEVAR